MVGDLGVLFPNQNPLCLNVIISFGLSCHFDDSMDDVGDATKVIPLGLKQMKTNINQSYDDNGMGIHTIHIPIDCVQLIESPLLLHLCISVHIHTYINQHSTQTKHSTTIHVKHIYTHLVFEKSS
jgi:hypothetical protein